MLVRAYGSVMSPPALSTRDRPIVVFERGDHHSTDKHRNISSLEELKQVQVSPLSGCDALTPNITKTRSAARPPKTKALIIGINYFYTRDELGGCVADAYNIRSFLHSHFNFPSPAESESEETIRVMTDEFHMRNTANYPSRANLLRNMHWLVDDAQAGDCLFLHYSGHGGSRRTKRPDNSSEIDGFDETIYPVDHAIMGAIVDNDLHDILVRPLSSGVRLTALFDSCHSGTILDLPFSYDLNSIKRSTAQKPMAKKSGFISNWLKPLQPAIVPLVKSNASLETQEPRVILFSACQDNQDSADTSDNANGSYGAMTYA
eukprot:Partr_v1_DN25236_c0_g1_i2_m16654 putative Metacaspase